MGTVDQFVYQGTQYVDIAELDENNPLVPITPQTNTLGWDYISGIDEKYRHFILAKITIPNKPAGYKDKIKIVDLELYISSVVGSPVNIAVYSHAAFAWNNVTWTYKDWFQSIQWDEADPDITTIGNEFVSFYDDPPLNWVSFFLDSKDGELVEFEWGKSFYLLLKGNVNSGFNDRYINFRSPQYPTANLRPRIRVYAEQKDVVVDTSDENSQLKVVGVRDQEGVVKLNWGVWSLEPEDFGEYTVTKEDQVGADSFFGPSITDISQTEKLQDLEPGVIAPENSWFYLKIQHQLLNNGDFGYTNKVKTVIPQVAFINMLTLGTFTWNLLYSFEFGCLIQGKDQDMDDYIDGVLIDWGDGLTSYVKNPDPTDLTPIIKARHMWFEHDLTPWPPTVTAWAISSKNIRSKAFTKTASSSIGNHLKPIAVLEVAPLVGDKTGSSNPTKFRLDGSKSFPKYSDKLVTQYNFTYIGESSPPGYQALPFRDITFPAGESYGQKTFQLTVKDDSGESPYDESDTVEIKCVLKDLSPVLASNELLGLKTGTTSITTRRETLERIKQVKRIDGTNISQVIDKGSALRKVSLRLKVKGPKAPTDIQTLYAYNENDTFVRLPVVDDDQSDYDGVAWTYNLDGWITKIIRNKGKKHISDITLEFLVFEVN